EELRTLNPVDRQAVILVEGISDQVAVETLAARLGHDLAGEGVSVEPVGGAHAFGRALARLGSHEPSIRLAGLYDIGEERVVQRALERSGLSAGVPVTQAGIQRLGFYACVVDLEDELIRALGAAAVEAIIDAQGELTSFRTLQKQPSWRGQRIEAQLRRFMGSGATRKIRYARLLVDALDLDQLPRPLRLVLAHVSSDSSPNALSR
ncbi:MAG TPA: TOPRIM nucleotidyl transferase/hydrolase domain-containing protein, partial [Thermomicrobiales bacterium]|nr:TOPRIM nucleotidyl transferase/hydrolase domain-containing protein [Thermomicrobiales bacterium]